MKVPLAQLDLDVARVSASLGRAAQGDSRGPETTPFAKCFRFDRRPGRHLPVPHFPGVSSSRRVPGGSRGDRVTVFVSRALGNRIAGGLAQQAGAARRPG